MFSNPLENYSPIDPRLSREQISDLKLKLFSCLLEEHSFKAVMKNQTSFFHAKTQADILAICVQQHDFFSIDFLGKTRLKILRTLKRYRIKPSSINLKNFLKHYEEDIKKLDGVNGTHLEINSLERIFDGILNKDQYPLFEKEIGVQSAIVYPINSREGDRIGYTIYFYLSNGQPIKENLPLVNELLESIIQPLYDLQSHTFHSKVLRLSSFVPEMTVREKAITQRLLKGHANTEIADELHISVNTVKTHLKNIFCKFDVNSKMELANKLKNIDL